MIDDHTKQTFRNTAWDYYHVHGRHDLPWRLPLTGTNAFDPYAILVSELMLQQTQVARVLPKYQQFMGQFPSVEALNRAQLSTVLRTWSGLGYNRRAKFLHQAAEEIVEQYGNEFPKQLAELIKLPGVGINTAAAIQAYAFNQSVVFVETNIRTVFIHHFFHDQTKVADEDILDLVSQTLDHEHPREWYWALMDYGAYLKQTIGNLTRQSQSYVKQSTFQGSRRQIRGQVIRLLSLRSCTRTTLQQHVPDERLEGVLDELLAEHLIRKIGKHYQL